MLISTAEAKDRLSALLSEVARGGEVTITKRGVPIAKLIPAGPSFDRERAQRRFRSARGQPWHDFGWCDDQGARG